MDLVSQEPFWLLKNGLPACYPPATSDLRCDVAVIGGGITGALIAEALTADGHDVVVLDRRDVATGSTSASTALLQYEIDTHFTELADRHGEPLARTAYGACCDAIVMLDERLTALGLRESAHFRRKDSVYLCSKRSHADSLRKEAAARERAGIPVTLWEHADVMERLSLDRPCALHTDLAAEVDPYRLAHGLLTVAAERGARIHDRTEVADMETTAEGVLLRTNRDTVVRAKRVVIAGGYESTRYVSDDLGIRLNSSFALAAELPPGCERWWKQCLLWESARPYFYLRETADGRVLMGGEDVRFRNPAARDAMVAAKTAELERKFGTMFPDLPLDVTCRWAGTFAETPDGLAYIGAYPGFPLTYFAMGFGGNGIVFSIIAAEIIRADLKGKIHPWAQPFSFGR